ncbi:hypothetical protein [Patulibacter medicamentivorans]|uniref:hypothetical protein n=1 Tax=Patulibacter medicamentivorans TaxID=1097667 RepID=UPI00058AEDF9|nr:hypothetical protein [Patulibacter medicamentivorans]
MLDVLSKKKLASLATGLALGLAGAGAAAPPASATVVGEFCSYTSVAPGGRCVGPKRDYRYIAVQALPFDDAGSGTVCVGGKGQADGFGPDTITFGCIYAWQFNEGTFTTTYTGFYGSGDKPRSYATIVNNSTSSLHLFGSYEYYPA